MRHLNQGRKLNRTSAHRKALFRNLVLSLVRYERIKTTDAKAKELRRYADRMVTLGKRGDLAASRTTSCSRATPSKNFSTRLLLVSRIAPAVTPASSSSGCAAATPPRYPLSSSHRTKTPKRKRRARKEPLEGMSRSAVNAAPPPPRNPLSQFAGFRGYREYTLAREFPSAGPSPARHGGCKKTKEQPPRRLPSAMKMRIQLTAATCLPCAHAQRTPFSARAGWAEGPCNPPATQRARDLQKALNRLHA